MAAPDPLATPVDARVTVTKAQVATVATKVAGVANTFSAANLTHASSLAAYAAAAMPIGTGLAAVFPAYSQPILAVAGAVSAVLALVVVFGARKAAVANPTVTATVTAQQVAGGPIPRTPIQG